MDDSNGYSCRNIDERKSPRFKNWAHLLLTCIAMLRSLARSLVYTQTYSLIGRKRFATALQLYSIIKSIHYRRHYWLHMGKIRQNGANLVFFEIQSRIARVQHSNSLWSLVYENDICVSFRSFRTVKKKIHALKVS